MSGDSARAASVPSRPLRADAARNRARIVEAAKLAFAEAGLDVGVEEIARRAGVGKGTLYRRFPTKEALVRAIFEDLLEDLERLVVEFAAVQDAGEAFIGFLHESARRQASNQGFLDVVLQRLRPPAPAPQQPRPLLPPPGEPPP